jgi:hypothetical protein
MKIKVLMLAFGEPNQERIVDVGEFKEIPNCHDSNYLEELLELVFHYGQNDFQPQQCPSVSVGDVAVLDDRYFFCAAVGWQKMLLAQLEEYKKMDRRDRLLAGLKNDFGLSDL